VFFNGRIGDNATFKSGGVGYSILFMLVLEFDYNLVTKHVFVKNLKIFKNIFFLFSPVLGILPLFSMINFNKCPIHLTIQRCMFSILEVIRL